MTSTFRIALILASLAAFLALLAAASALPMMGTMDVVGLLAAGAGILACRAVLARAGVVPGAAFLAGALALALPRLLSATSDALGVDALGQVWPVHLALAFAPFASPLMLAPLARGAPHPHAEEAPSSAA